MPLFAAYGLLTALMIAMALVATLIVLPSVLVAITRDRGDEDHIDLQNLEHGGPDKVDHVPVTTLIRMKFVQRQSIT